MQFFNFLKIIKLLNHGEIKKKIYFFSEDDQAVPKSGTINRRTKGTDWVPEPVYPLPPPPPPPPEREPYDDDDAHRVNASPTPPPPPLPTPPTAPAQAETGKSWLSRLSPLKSRKDIMTSDANENNSGFVDLYYSVSDVRLWKKKQKQKIKDYTSHVDF